LEEIVGEALKGRRHNIVLATKVNAAMGEDPTSRQFAPPDHAGGAGVAATPADRPYRTLPAPPALARH